MTIAPRSSPLPRRVRRAVVAPAPLVLVLLSWQAGAGPPESGAGSAGTEPRPGATSGPASGSGSAGRALSPGVPHDLPVGSPPPAGAEDEAPFADGARPQIGTRHPALELDALDGSLVNAGRLAGRPLVLEFFATWCQPCHRALADLLVLRKAPRSSAIVVVLVSVGEEPEVVRRWLTSAGLPGDIIITTDPAGHAASRWGARRLPTTFLVDSAGVIRHINRGWGAGYRNRMRRWLDRL